MPTTEFQPEDFDRSEHHSEREARLIHPVAGTCPTCLADLTADSHEGWCPDA